MYRCLRILSRQVLKVNRFSTSQHLPVLKELTEKYKDNENLIVDLFKEPKHLIQDTNLQQWTTTIEAFTKFGFTMEEVVGVLAKYPELLSLHSLEGRLTKWFHLEMGIDFFLEVIKYHPEFLTVPEEELNRRIPFLHGLTNSRKNLLILLINCPNVLFDNWNEILAKVNYIEEDMRLGDAEIIRSRVLSRSLDHIKVRHKFLERCGVFVKPKLKVEPTEKHINPPLKRIVDNSDLSFSKRIAGVSLEEYECFKEIYKQEMNESSEYFSGEDSDTD